MDVDVILKRFESPDELREMEKGTFEIVRSYVSLHFLGVQDYAKKK